MDVAFAARVVEHFTEFALPILPSIIVGATRHPKTAGALRTLSHVLQFFSILSHKDCPGTFKAPCSVHKDGDDAEISDVEVREPADDPSDGSAEPSSADRADRPPAERAEGSSEVDFLRAVAWRLIFGPESPPAAPWSPRK